MTDPRTLLKDAGHVAVGLGVMAFQRGQVRRRELEEQLAEAGITRDRITAVVDDTRKLVEERAGALGEQLEGTTDELEARVEQVLAEVRTYLPEQALEAFDIAVSTARDVTGQLLDLVRPTRAA